MKNPITIIKARLKKAAKEKQASQDKIDRKCATVFEARFYETNKSPMHDAPSRGRLLATAQAKGRVICHGKGLYLTGHCRLESWIAAGGWINKQGGGFFNMDKADFAEIVPIKNL